MIDEHLVGSWWIFKDGKNRLFTYKGQDGPKCTSSYSCCIGDNPEFSWMYLNDPNDASVKCKSGAPRPKVKSTTFLTVVDISLLDLSPGSAIQVEIFPSGNWVVYDN